MLFFLGQDRSYLNEKAKPEGMLRVVCVGDSMTFGQGCLPTQTMPFQLENILNTALWERQMEVINGGVCGYSIHDAWNRYLDKFADYKANLVILTVCDNDAELYNHRESKDKNVLKKTYIEFSEDCYNPAGEHFPYFRLILKDIANYVYEEKVPVLIAFYDIHGGQHREKIMPRIRDACFDAKLPFADLSEDFLETAAATNNKLLKVSSVDAHPSALAHGIAARRLARFIIKENLLFNQDSNSISETTIFQNCMKTADQQTFLSSNLGKILFHLKRTMNAKRDSRSRIKLADSELVNDMDYKKMLTSLNQTWRQFIDLTIWESYFYGFRDDIKQFGFGLSLFDMDVSRLAKSMYVLEKRLQDNSLPIVIEFQMPMDEKYISTSDNLEDIQTITSNFLISNAKQKVNIWKQKYLRAKEFFFNSNRVNTEQEEIKLLPNMDNILQSRLESLKLQILPLWQQVECIFDTLERHFARIENITVLIIKQNQPNSVKSLERVYGLLERAIKHLDFCLTALRFDNLNLISRASENDIQSCLTTIQVRLTAPAFEQVYTNKEPLSLEIQVRSFAPFRHVVSDVHTVVGNGTPYVYCFQLPFFMDAELCLGLKGGQGVELETVQLFNAEDRPITLSPANFEIENDGQIFRANRVFVPL